MNKKLFSFVLVLAMLFTVNAFPYTATLTWDKPTANFDLVEGYNIYLSTTSGSYNTSPDVVVSDKNLTSFTFNIDSIPDGRVYCVITSYNSESESIYSNETSAWKGQLPELTAPNANEFIITKTVGNIDVFSDTTINGSRRAMPFTMPEDGNIESISMYHDAGSGSMILAVYDGETAPQNRIGVTLTTSVNGSSGWQTINLTNPVFVASGSTIWLTWVYENNPGIRFQYDSPGRYESPESWAGGMPDVFGVGTQESMVYSIYANYTQ